MRIILRVSAALAVCALSIGMWGGPTAAAPRQPAPPDKVTTRADPGRAQVTDVTGKAPRPSASRAAYFSNCPLQVNFCQHDTGWENYGTGCWARTYVGWWRNTNYASVQLHVYNTGNPFSACRVNSTLKFGTSFGLVLDGKSFHGMACGTWDPTCSSYRVWNYYEDSGLHPFFPPYVQSLSASHAQA